MESLGLSRTEEESSALSPRTVPELRVCFHDTLAAGDRLWIRGRLSNCANGNGNGDKRSWWKPWRKNGEQEPPPLHFETSISGQTLRTVLTVQPQGNFDGLLTAVLPAARRGWRIARNRISLNGHAANACNVVLLPQQGSRAVAVILPVAASWPGGAAEALHTANTNLDVRPRLDSLRRSAGQPLSIYYFALTSPDGELHRPDLAVAMTALGWPPGTLVMLPGEQNQIGKTITGAIDRLRWLLHGSHDLHVLHLDPEWHASFEACLHPSADRAEARLLARISDADRMTWLAGTRGHTRPSRASLLPRYPVVFCHGMLGYSMLKMHRPTDINYFSSLRGFLDPRGVHVLFPRVGPTSGVVERAEELRDQIIRWTEEPVNIVAHSMGGLDARYMIAKLGLAARVRSLTTIATPHRGSYMADWFQANFRRRVPLLLAAEAIGFNVDGFSDCRPDACRKLNVSVQDAPIVRYFSYGGDVPPARLTPFLRRAWALLKPVEGPNDGLVSVESSRWGEYLGAIQADHFAQTPDGVFVRDREDFDALGFYLKLIEDLARRGF